MTSVALVSTILSPVYDTEQDTIIVHFINTFSLEKKTGWYSPYIGPRPISLFNMQSDNTWYNLLLPSLAFVPTSGSAASKLALIKQGPVLLKGVQSVVELSTFKTFTNR